MDQELDDVYILDEKGSIKNKLQTITEMDQYNCWRWIYLDCF